MAGCYSRIGCDGVARPCEGCDESVCGEHAADTMAMAAHRADRYKVLCRQCCPTLQPCPETGDYHGDMDGDVCGLCGYTVLEDTRDGDYERDNRTFSETHGGRL